MTFRSYLVDVRSLLNARWWVAWVLLPTIGLGLGLYVVAEPLWGATNAETFTRWYGIVGGGFVVGVVALDVLRTRFLVDDVDHFAE